MTDQLSPAASPGALRFRRAFLLSLALGISVLFFLVIAAVVAVIFAWFAVLFTGRYPRSVFAFVEGVLRWGLRVEAYALLLVTDRYPPFSLA